MKYKGDLYGKIANKYVKLEQTSDDFGEPIFTKRTEGVKVYFSTHELAKKPVKFWANIGDYDKNGPFARWIRAVKRVVGQQTLNGILHLTYYGGGRTLYPFQCNWRGTEYDIHLYDPFGEPLYTATHATTDENESFKEEDMVRISKIMETHSHAIRSAYNIFKKRDFDSYSEVFEFAKKIHFLVEENE